MRRVAWHELIALRRVSRIHGTPSLRYRFAYMSTLEIAIHVEALVVAAFAILVSLSGIAPLWAFRKIARLAS
jgi:hypothetical protein